MGSTSRIRSEGFELQISGPLCLSSDEPESLTWLAKTGSYVVGWAKLCRLQQQVGLLRELHLSDSARNPLAVASRLCSAIFEYARDHGLLKLKIHQDCVHDCLRPALSHAGFSHDEHRPTGSARQVYVDLYRGPRHRLYQEPAEESQRDEVRMAC